MKLEKHWLEVCKQINCYTHQQKISDDQHIGEKSQNKCAKFLD